MRPDQMRHTNTYFCSLPSCYTIFETQPRLCTKGISQQKVEAGRHWTQFLLCSSMKNDARVFNKLHYCVCIATVFVFSVLICLLDQITLKPFFSSVYEKDTNATATILIWSHPFGLTSECPDCFALFNIRGCRITDDRGAYSQADGVVVHHRDVVDGRVHLPPEPRPRTQKWIWMNFESPSHTPDVERYDGVFNLTMSYRRDSDIFIPSGWVMPLEHKDGDAQTRPGERLYVPSSIQIVRPRLVAWVISNWSEKQARVVFYNELRRYVEVDVYGRGHRSFPEDSGNSVVRLVQSYLFYLAMENSQHTDYITEKLWNAIEAGAIPVVLGPTRQSYERFLPPKAFIHVDDFPTVRALAQYLLTLRSDPDGLRRHLEWRKGYSLFKPYVWAEHYCIACKAVMKTRGRTAVVQSLSRWFRS